MRREGFRRLSLAVGLGSGIVCYVFVFLESQPSHGTDVRLLLLATLLIPSAIVAVFAWAIVTVIAWVAEGFKSPGS
jgi:hypothetical protein